jgi:hypothetical protein
MILHMSEYQIEMVTEIFELVRTHKIIPSIWKDSNMVLLYLYKGKENKASPTYYRPIALLSCLYKLYTSIMNERPTKWMEDNEIITENQQGFRKGTDTYDDVAEILTCIEHAILTGRKIHAVFLDVAKAYDSVEH